ncbi:MAG TPA: hypothetical protein VGZ29_01635 [Terriglobia bacterium]|nr:hypothetical protein [Terriglobia bacterium]
MRLIVLLAAGFCLGIYCFFRGFRFLRRYEMLADTPRTPIRAAAMGFVEVSGKASGPETVYSPVSHTQCYFYRVDIDRWHQGSRGGGRWAPFATDGDGVRFYLEDETGRVLVDAQDAEFDLQDAGQTQVMPDFLPAGDDNAPSPPYMPTTENDLVEYIHLVSSGSRTAAFRGVDPALEYRVNPPGKKPRPRAKSGFQGLRLPGSGDSGSPGSYRLTEYCIVPQKAYTVAGTCVENPRPHGEQDRNLILKGENQPTFLISDESKADLQSALGWRTGKYIFGGAALTVTSAALLLQAMGWLQSDFLAQLLK